MNSVTGNNLMLGNGITGTMMPNGLVVQNTEESKRDMTLTNGGEGENDINIDLGKELMQGDMDDGTQKF